MNTPSARKRYERVNFLSKDVVRDLVDYLNEKSPAGYNVVLYNTHSDDYFDDYMEVVVEFWEES